MRRWYGACCHQKLDLRIDLGHMHVRDLCGKSVDLVRRLLVRELLQGALSRRICVAFGTIWCGWWKIVQPKGLLEFGDGCTAFGGKVQEM